MEQSWRIGMMFCYRNPPFSALTSVTALLQLKEPVTSCQAV
jgi:hypothetical protein